MLMADMVAICGSLIFIIADVWAGIIGRLICGFAVGLNSAVGKTQKINL